MNQFNSHIISQIYSLQKTEINSCWYKKQTKNYTKEVLYSSLTHWQDYRIRLRKWPGINGREEVRALAKILPVNLQVRGLLPHSWAVHILASTTASKAPILALDAWWCQEELLELAIEADAPLFLFHFTDAHRALWLPVWHTEKRDCHASKGWANCKKLGGWMTCEAISSICVLPFSKSPMIVVTI